MKKSLNLNRLLVETLAAVLGAEFLIMLAVPVTLPGVEGTTRALLEATLLGVLAGPVMLWRMSSAVRASEHERPSAATESKAARDSRVESEHAAQRANLLAGVVLIAGLVLTGVAAYQSKVHVHNKARVHFDQLTQRLTAAATDRIERPAHGLRGARGLFKASKSVERGEFMSFFAHRDLAVEFPGIAGFGFIQRVKRADLQAFVAAQQNDGAPDFSVEFRTVELANGGDSADMWVMKFDYPRDPINGGWGLGVGMEPKVHAAINAAIRTGRPTLTEQIQVLHDCMERPGVLYLLAVYKNGTDPKTPAEREGALVGLVYAPIILDYALRGVVTAVEGALDFEVFEGQETTKSTQLFDYDRHLDSAVGVIDKRYFANRMFETLTPVTVGDRDWTIITSTTPAFESGLDHITPALVGVGGALLSLLLAGIVWSLGMSRSRALSLATGMTADLRASERRLQAMFDAEPECVKILDDRGVVVNINPAGLLLLEVETVGDLRGLNVTTLVAPEYRAMFTADLGRAAAGEQVQTLYEIVGLKGTRRWIEQTAVGLNDPSNSGAIKHVLVVARDVTERRAAEQRMAESKNRFRTLADSAPMLVWTSGTDGKCDYFNKPWLAFTGRTLEEELGDGWAMGVHIDDVGNCLAAHAEAFEARRPFEIEYRLMRHDGVHRMILCRGVPRTSTDGRFDGFVGACVDVTDLRLAQARAESASKAKSEFLANMSHEIRTPLTAILGFTDLLRDDGQISLAPKQRIQTIDTIKNAGTHLLTVINDILDLSKIEADKMTVERIDTSLIAVLREVESLMRPRASGKGLTFKLDFATPAPERIMSDPTRLRQILLNLAGNAVKFTEEGSVTITVSTAARSGQQALVIDIEDTGPGMTQVQSGKLFAAFGQADGTVSRKYGGTGLGLTISRRLAGLMGGTVTLQRTAPGEGSCFRVELPMEAVHDAALIERLDAGETSTSSAQSVAPVNLKGRILLAEDGIDNQRLISFHLRKAGATVEIADNGRIALEMIESAQARGNPFDLLFTDIQMPEVDGYTLARALRDSGSTLAIVALTAHAMAEDRERCIEAGCDDYATKPIDKAALIATCKKWIGKPSGAIFRTKAA